MKLNTDRIDDAVLALLLLGLHEKTGPGEGRGLDAIAVCTTLVGTQFAPAAGGDERQGGGLLSGGLGTAPGPAANGRSQPLGVRQLAPCCANDPHAGAARLLPGAAAPAQAQPPWRSAHFGRTRSTLPLTLSLSR